MKPSTVKIPAIQYRSFTVQPDAIDPEKRTARMIFSTETPVSRSFGMEVLDHAPTSVNLSRLLSKAPLLSDHNPERQIGVVESASISDKQGHAVVRFSKSKRGQQEFQDVQDGIRTQVSVGYQIERAEDETGDDDEVSTYRVTRWTPLEVSLVSIGADPYASIRKVDAADGALAEVEIISTRAVPNMEKTAPEKETPTAKVETIDLAAERASILKGEQARAAEINHFGNTFNAQTEASEYIRSGKSAEEFKDFILREKLKATPVTASSTEVGMSEKEKRSYSVTSAIMGRLAEMSQGVKWDGLEAEVNAECVKKFGRSSAGFFIPTEIARRPLGQDGARTMTAGSAGAGGNFVQTDVLGQDLIELLRNRQVVIKAGARSLSGLQGNVAIPRQTGGATAYWLGENSASTASQATITQLLLSPKRLAAFTDYSRTLLVQSTVDVEAFVRYDLMAQLAIAKDLAALAGTGLSNQPTGVQSTASVGSVTFGGAATWAKLVSMWTPVAQANADLGSLAYVISPGSAAKFKVNAKIAGYPQFLMDSDNSIGGYPAIISNQVPSDVAFFGNWNDLIVADWAGFEIIPDQYTQATLGNIRVSIQLLTDVGVRHPASFTVSTDSAAQ